MIQIKCGNCKMLCNIDEKTFVARRNEKGYIYESPTCLSCGKEMPISIIRHIFSAIDKKDFDGWEIGTFFKE